MEFEGEEIATWSHAGLGMKDEPSVWLEGGPEEPVPITRLKVPGWDLVPKSMVKKEGPPRRK